MINKRSIWMIGLFLLMAILLPEVGHTHALGTNLVQLDISQESTLEYKLTWSGSSRNLKLVFPSDCISISQSSGISVSDSSTVKCSATLDGRKIRVAGLKESSLDLIVRIIPQNTGEGEQIRAIMVNGTNNVITMDSEPTVLQVAQTYFLLGVEHIFGGIDHLLFVLGLLLILNGWRQLAFTITAFTVAHSITLALATFGVISVPSGPVEAVIALSIVFLATEYARQLRGVQGVTSRRPWLVSFSVGLLHGLGFAGALSEVGLPQSEIPLALLTFNLGVEAGQMMFVAGVLLFINLALKVLKETPSWTKVTTAYGIGAVAAFWFIERTLAIII